VMTGRAINNEDESKPEQRTIADRVAALEAEIAAIRSQAATPEVSRR